MSKNIIAGNLSWVISSLILFILTLSCEIQAKEWRGVVPLKSARAEVEKIFGISKTGFYQFETEKVAIHYSSGDLKGGDCVSKAPKDVVTRIYVLPEDEMPLEKLNLDLSKFEKTRSAKFPNLITYYDEKEGVAYTVDEGENNDITEITYFHSKQDCENLLKSSTKSLRAELCL